MDARQAVMAFSQSEKMKFGIIGVSNCLEVQSALYGLEQAGGLRVVQMQLEFIFQELRLARKLAGDGPWLEIEQSLDQALVMIRSGVAAESIPHLTRALSQVTNVGQRAMVFLQEQGLI